MREFRDLKSMTDDVTPIPLAERDRGHVVTPIPLAERESRLTKARRLMTESGIRAIYLEDEPVGFVLLYDESLRLPPPPVPQVGL